MASELVDRSPCRLRLGYGLLGRSEVLWKPRLYILLDGLTIMVVVVQTETAPDSYPYRARYSILAQQERLLYLQAAVDGRERNHPTSRTGSGRLLQPPPFTTTGIHPLNDLRS